MKKKYILLIPILCLFLNCELRNKKEEIVIKKIKIQNYSCQYCIGLKSIKIIYELDKNNLLNDTISFYSKKHFLYKMKKSSFPTSNKKDVNSEYIYDKFDLSRYGSLYQIKNDYKEVIYFKRFRINNSDYELVTNSDIKILFYLNNVNVKDTDTFNMRKGEFDKVKFK
jgi:hypothetical protein